jgi:hypothetical protein
MLNHLMGVGTRSHSYYLIQDSNNQTSIMLIMRLLDNNFNYKVLFLKYGTTTLRIQLNWAHLTEAQKNMT